MRAISYFLLAACLCLTECLAVNFTACRQKIIDYQANGNTSAIALSSDPIYHGAIFGFNGLEERPITLTYQGCKDVCGSGTEPNDVDEAFSILTTWVLPVIALLSSIPYESNHSHMNFEAFFNWVGSPAAALTTTIWNILMIRRCQKLAQKDPRKKSILKDCMFILSCVNQYQYPRRGRLPQSKLVSPPSADRRRDLALLRGTLFPLCQHPHLQPGQPLREKLDNITHHLAFQLRLQRRRGVFPLGLSIVWFLLSFIVSVVLAFAQLGDNTTAHSLALGLLLSWMPILVVATVIDRNPVSATRCGILIERWLYNVDVFCSEAGLNENDREVIPPQRYDYRLQSIDADDQLLLPTFGNVQRGKGIYLEVPGGNFSRGTEPEEDVIELTSTISYDPGKEEVDLSIRSETSTLRQRSPGPVLQQWRQTSYLDPFHIWSYVGQGRRLRYCAVTDTVLDLFWLKKASQHIDIFLPTEQDADEFKRRLPSRPVGWYITWLVCQLLVGIGFSMAFLVSFNTPTIGLGCRTVSYLVWYLLSLVSWVIMLLWQEPPPLIRHLSWIPNILAASALFTIMGMQLTGGLNTCLCKSSMFGSSKYGGYMDFENAEFYHKAYDVSKIWGLATAFGVASCTLAIAWLYRRWSRDSSLWSFREEFKPDIIDGVDLHWLT